MLGVLNAIDSGSLWLTNRVFFLGEAAFTVITWTWTRCATNSTSPTMGTGN